jgi:signal transduction histidine kinase/CheY-like chemotaxis protein
MNALYDAQNGQNDENIRILHSILIRRIAIMIAWLAGFGMWLTVQFEPFAALLFALCCAVLLLCWYVRQVNRKDLQAARHILIWGLTAILFVAMLTLDTPWLPFLGIPTALLSAMLFAGGGLVAGLALALFASILTFSGMRAYPLEGLIIAFLLSIGCGWLVAHTLYTALEWYRVTQERSDRLLEETRDHRAELRRTLNSLANSYETQQRVQQELIWARKQADEARQLKEHFAANISHELRTPLNIILGFSEVMYLSPEVYGDVEWTPALRRDIYHVYRSSRHLLEMIDDILDLSRFEATGFSLNLESTSLESLLNDTIDIAKDLFKRSSIVLNVDLEPNLPTLRIDPTRIRQVLLNLLSNAVRFTDVGTVRVEARRVEQDVVIAVRDTGSGIAPDKLPYLFDEFYQVDTTLRRSHSGVGLGLAICKRFVQAHDGRIWVESKPGVGSTFSFSLPIPRSFPPTPRAGIYPMPVSPDFCPTVLVLDPDPKVGELFQRHMEHYNIVQMTDPGALEGAVQTYYPRSVIYNVEPEAFERSALPTLAVPTIICSLPSQKLVAENLDIHAWLPKPVTSERLLKEVNRLDNVEDILIVDDDRGFVLLLERILLSANHGFKIRRAYSGSEGLQTVRSFQPDLVLIDIIIPELNGLEVLREMKTDPMLARIPVIMISATDDPLQPRAWQHSQLRIQRAGGLSLSELLGCIQAVNGVFSS